jgi:hypothetical protein
MKFLFVVIFLTLSFTSFGQKKITGQYRDYFGSRIQLNADSSFKYSWNFDMSASWTKGQWTFRHDTIYFHMVPTYDTLRKITASGVSDSLILSTDEFPERFTQTQFAGMPLSSGGQNRMTYPEKLFFRKGRLYNVRDGKLVVKKQKGWWSNKKWDPWFFKSDE